MDYKQKYIDALERARKFSEKPMQEDSADIVEYIFPELKESEDERIKRVIRGWIYTRPASFFDNGISKEEILAWLEKQGVQKNTHKREIDDAYLQGICDAKHEIEIQGEQKPADKVEPKFHEGDWVVYNNDICQIVKREEGCNKLVTVFGIEKELVNERNLSTARLWTIDDAKEGDVLVDEDNNIGLYSGEKDDLYWHSCIYLGCDGYIRGGFRIGGYHTHKNTKPATEEQRDMLFHKMKETGYEWDAEKKELKKIEPKTLNADNVIEWIDEHVPTKFEDMENYVKQFKQDFGL